MKFKNTLFYSLLSIIFIINFATNIATGQVDPFSNVSDKMNEITGQEKEIIENLFLLSREIRGIEVEIADSDKKLQEIQGEITALEVKIKREEEKYKKNINALKEILNYYQKNGSNSFLEIILNSESLSDFLRRINIIRDFTHRAGRLLTDIKESEEQLLVKKRTLNNKLMDIADRQKHKKENLLKKQAVLAENEEYLASLKDKRAYYEEYLSNIELMWNEILPLFTDIIKEFSNIIKDNTIPSEALKISIDFPNVKGSLKEEGLNDMIKNNHILSQMGFRFEPDKVKITVPSKELVLIGTFEIVEGNGLIFNVVEGSFYGMPLEDYTIRELFKKGSLTLNLEPLIGKSTVKAIEILDGYLELTIKPFFK